ncbi:MAG TPA: PAS domain S-box protein, partial [Opitutus sp.]|nr:PAS domain S-box protein [Opitutus sp.]
MPHGFCYLWSPKLLSMHVSSDVLIAASYVAIAITLLRIVRRRRDGSFSGVGISFALFIVTCGFTHLLEAWNIWHADYWLSAWAKSVTAIASVGTAIYVFRLRTAILILPTPRQVAALNAKLRSRSSELKQTENALRASEEQFRTAFDFAGIGMAVVGLDGRWLRVNSRVCEITGYAEPELLATTVEAITVPEDTGRYREALDGLRVEAQRFFQLEKRYRHKAGHSVAIRLTMALVRGPEGAPVHFVAQIEDVSDRKRLEEQLQHSRKMEAVGQLAGGIAHDYNN